MFVVPPAEPVIPPVAAPIVPTLVLLLAHVPPEGVAVAVCVDATHIAGVILTVGVGFTVICFVTSQLPVP